MASTQHLDHVMPGEAAPQADRQPRRRLPLAGPGDGSTGHPGRARPRARAAGRVRPPGSAAPFPRVRVPVACRAPARDQRRGCARAGRPAARRRSERAGARGDRPGPRAGGRPAAGTRGFRSSAHARFRRARGARRRIPRAVRRAGVASRRTRRASRGDHRAVGAGRDRGHGPGPGTWHHRRRDRPGIRAHGGSARPRTDRADHRRSVVASPLARRPARARHRARPRPTRATAGSSRRACRRRR